MPTPPTIVATSGARRDHRRIAAALTDSGFGKGVRVALYLQNMPQFVIAQIGTWKVGIGMS